MLSSSFFSCASTALDSVFSEPDIITHDAVSERSADDLALALSEKPEYTEIFDLFVSLLVMMQEQKPLKTISRMAQQLRNQIFFVQKYASDPLLDEILAWCQAQKGLGKKKVAALQRYRNRRCVYENPAIVVFYTTQADLIQFMVTSGDEDSCTLVV